MADVTLVGLLARVDAQVALQFERVGAGVGAVRALVGPLARVAPHVALQFAQLDRRVVALGAPVWFLVRVPVAHMAYQFSRSGERTVAVLAPVRFSARVGVDVVLQRRQRLEAPVAHAALVRTLLRVALHVPRQQVPVVCNQLEKKKKKKNLSLITIKPLGNHLILSIIGCDGRPFGACVVAVVAHVCLRNCLRDFLEACLASPVWLDVLVVRIAAASAAAFLAFVKVVHGQVLVPCFLVVLVVQLLIIQLVTHVVICEKYSNRCRSDRIFDRS